MGWFLMVTGVVVVIGVLLQLRAGQQTLRQVAGFLLFSAGLIAAGAARAFLEGTGRSTVTYAGVVVVLIGLVVARLGWNATSS